MNQWREIYERSSKQWPGRITQTQKSLWFRRLTNCASSSPNWIPAFLSDTVLKGQDLSERKGHNHANLYGPKAKLNDVTFLFWTWILSLNTCSMAYDELNTPLLLLLELVEESAELPDGVPLPEVFTVRICSSEKPSWWRSFWSLFTVSCKKWFLNYWEGKERKILVSD